MKLGKWSVLAVSALVAASLVTGCGSSGSSTQSSKAPYEIGQVVALTGDGAASGQLQVDGAKLAIEEINAKGGVNGHPLKLITEDDQTTNPGTVNAFSKLVSQYPNLVAILGPIRSTEVQAITPNIEQAGIPTSIGGTDPELTNENNPWVFRTRPNDNYSAETMAYYLIDKLNLKNIAIVHSTDAFGVGGEKAILGWIKKDGGTVAADIGYPNHLRDYTSIVNKLKTANPQAIDTYFTYSTDCGIFLKQLNQFGVTAPVMGSSSISASETRKLLGDKLNGDYSTTDFEAEQNPAAAQFAKAFAAAYPGQMADIYSAHNYDAVQLIAKALATGATTHQAVMKAILAIKNYQGAEGMYNFDPNGDGLHGYTVMQFKGSTPQMIGTYDFYKPASGS